MGSSSIQEAASFIENRFPNCDCAFLGGSVARGADTDHSDWDVIIFDETQPGPFHGTMPYRGRRFEAFVLNRDTYRYFFDLGVESALPTLQRLIAFGLPLRTHPELESVIREALADLEQGPPAWSRQELDKARYEISEDWSDLSGSKSREESLLIAGSLFGRVQRFKLRAAGKWLGEGKWLYRELAACDADYCARLYEAGERFFRDDCRKPLLDITAETLAPYGGLLFTGFFEGMVGDGEW
ncbi:nucleotidyltransferase domain-containing protein [Paenibacillus ginsengihumi]|uniref:nucleotidyltransferase domain-containing protein n=1 Tax=Paenibacillus ginsengihumi TaxID=431596 RepID=UPI00037D0224|nr:nucleotidyltransferase domain-containing protein [Paenibacillus ginsengihumi]